MARQFFFDTEFMEEPGYLDLISIAIVGEHGEFYAGNAEADFSRANPWVKENVFPKLPPILYPGPDERRIEFGGDPDEMFDSPLVNHSGGFWATKDVLRKQLLDFLKPSKDDPVELWGYYADYDHVLLCWLFGRMIDLPKGMPMLTRDVKQLALHLGNPQLPKDPADEHDAFADAWWIERSYRFLKELAEREPERWKV